MGVQAGMGIWVRFSSVSLVPLEFLEVRHAIWCEGIRSADLAPGGETDQKEGRVRRAGIGF